MLGLTKSSALVNSAEVKLSVLIYKETQKVLSPSLTQLAYVRRFAEMNNDSGRKF